MKSPKDKLSGLLQLIADNCMDEIYDQISTEIKDLIKDVLEIGFDYGVDWQVIGLPRKDQSLQGAYDNNF